MIQFKSLWKSPTFIFTSISRSNHKYPSSISSHFTTYPSNSTLYDQIFCQLATSTSLSDLKQTHALVITHNLLSKTVLACRLIAAYSRLSNHICAQKVFASLPRQNTYTFNHMLKAYIDHRRYKLALVLYHQLLTSKDIAPDDITFCFVIQASIAVGAMRHAKLLHARILVIGLQPDLRLVTSLMDFYTKCGCGDYAEMLFDRITSRDVFVWTVMMNRYLQTGQYRKALLMFSKMREEGVEISIVTWNALLAGFVHGGLIFEALREFRRMLENGVRPDKVSLCTIIPGLAQVAILKLCLQAHAYVIRMGFEMDLYVVSSLVDMYAKCGNLAPARYLFDRVRVKDSALWNAMIVGYGAHGQGDEALQLFHQMHDSGAKPNDITFTSILSACSHAGMVNQGCQFFNSMVCDYGIVPCQEHYTCMVDMFGRAGKVGEAYKFIRSIPLEPTRDLWGAFMGACRTHREWKLAEVAGEEILKCKGICEEAGYHVILSNIYAETGRWGEVAKLRTSIRDAKLRKKTGFSWIEIGGFVHTFYMADGSHPKSENIYSLLRSFKYFLM